MPAIRTTLNIIGCGRLGRTLARLWSDTGVLTIGAICNRTMSSTQNALGFIQAGHGVEHIHQLPGARFWLIATPDSEIEASARQLAENSVLTSKDIVFHCSGSLTADSLLPLAELGIHTASIHPIHSFADPQQSQQSFSGTFCAMEGNPVALATLEPLWQQIGGRTFTLNGDNKALYHAATTVASNYLVTLLDTALGLFDLAGLPRQQARQLLEPIVQQTAGNVCKHDSAIALTGPIARGDIGTVASHLKAIGVKADHYNHLYRLLGEHTLPISRLQGTASEEQLKQLVELLKSDD